MILSSDLPFTSEWALPAADVLAAVTTAPTSGADAALAEALGVPANCLVLGAGVGELVLALRLALAHAPDLVVLPGLHPWRRLFRHAAEVPHRANGHLDLADLMAMLSTQAADLVIVGSPDPVTGSPLLMPEASLILDASPGALLIDGTYHEFAHDQWLQAAVHHDRLLVVRPLTLLSQAVPVAYLVAPPAVTAAVRETLQPLPAFLQAIVHSWLSLAGQGQALIEAIEADRQSLYRLLLRTPGIDVLASQANFLGVRGGGDLWQPMAEAGLPVAKVAQSGPLQDLWRLGIGDMDTNQRVAACLHQVALTPA